MLRASDGIIRTHHSRLALLHRLADGCCIFFSLSAACWIFAKPCTESDFLAAAAAFGLFNLVAENNDLYRSWRGAALQQEILRIITSWSGAVACCLLIAFALKVSARYSRLVVCTWVLLAPLAISFWHIALRLALRLLRGMGMNTRTVAIAGAGALGVRVANFVLKNPWLGMRLLGFYDDNKPVDHQPPAVEAPVKINGNLDDLCIHACCGGVDLVYITLPLRAQDRMRQVIGNLADSTASVYLVPDFFTFDLLQARSMQIDGMYAVSVFESPFADVSGWIKRLEDMVIGSVLLLLTALPMLFIAMGVKLSSPGPVFFRQRRYGINGQDVVVWKFRTMTVCEDGPELPQAKKCDPRVTRFGAFLRRTSLDELPQFINVVQGRMSVVGPRPHAVAHNEMYRKMIHGYMLRHKVKPGITGWAQVNG